VQHPYKPALRQFTVVFILAILIFIFGLSSSLVEQVYSDHIYLWIAAVLRAVSARVPFPLGDLLYLLLIGFVLFKGCLFIRKALQKKLSKANGVLVPLALGKFILILYIAFKLLWGLNYSRPPINKRLGITDAKYNNKELIALAAYLINNINRIQQERSINPQTKNKVYSIGELQAGAVASYAGLSKSNQFFRYPQPVVKKVLNTWMITKIGLEGYYSPVSGEANLNMRIPAADLPFVTCHEIAHQLGIGREDEANLIGYLVSTHSPDLNFQYSGDYSVLTNVLIELRIKEPERYLEVIKQLNAGTIADFKKEQDFWIQYNSDMSLYMGVAFDKFLKLNNQDKGINSYQDIVIWLYNLHKNELKIK
jgi:hypothetical protein